MVINGDFLSILLIAVGLSADCFAVALSGGIANRNHSLLQALRVSFSFGFFQSLMLVLGWLAGRTVVEFISSFDHWIAFALLAFVGGKMLWEAFHPEDDEEKEIDISRGFLLLTLSIATSIDSLAVGLSFAFLEVNIGLAIPVIGIVAFMFTVLGFLAGKRAGRLLDRRAEALGGLILLGIALKVLLSHLFE